MLSTTQFNTYLTELLSNTEKTTSITQELRLALIGELDAINLYDQLAQKTDNELVKKTLLEISQEEKVHCGELNKLLELLDNEERKARADGAKEVREKE